MNFQTKVKVRAKATVGRIIDPEIINNVQNLLIDYGKIAAFSFAALYNHKYKQNFCASEMGFDDGISGFFAYIWDMVDEHQDKDGIIYYSLSPEYKKKLNGEIDFYCRFNNVDTDIFLLTKDLLSQDEREVAQILFNDELLWSSEFKDLKYLAQKIRIVKSPFETAWIRDPERVQYQVGLIRKTLLESSDGILLNELSKSVPIDLRLFSSTSIAFLVDNYPEIFYKDEKRYGEREPLIFDGFTNTIKMEQLTLEPNTRTSILVYRSIYTGLYQETLMLLNKTGSSGLKVSVWFDSLRNNFSCSKHEKYLLKENPIDLAIALNSHKLVTIKSNPKIFNDLRLFFPQSAIDFTELMGDLSEQISSYKRVHQQEMLGMDQINSSDNESCNLNSEKITSDSSSTSETSGSC